MRSGLRALQCLRERSPRDRKTFYVHPRLEYLEDRLAPSADFVQTNLISDVPGLAQVADANGVNAWGLVAGPGGPFWVANQGSGTSTLYSAAQPQAQVEGLVVNIPANPADKPTPVQGSPTGIVFNTSGAGFNVTENGKTGSSVFLFATTDGTISGWSPRVDGTHALIGATNTGAVYTGLAIATDSKGATLLYAADFAKNTIDVYDQNFNPVTSLPGNFSDSKLPDGYRVFNVQAINNQIYVEYAPFDSATGGVLPGTGNGVVDVYNSDGQLQQRLIQGGVLNDPWGVAMAPANFGAFSNDLLVGNFGSGNINAFDPTSGKFLGELSTSSGQPFNVEHLWALEFGNSGSAGPANTLFFTAGLTSHFGAGSGTPHGLFGSIQAVPTVPANTQIVPNLNNFPVQTVTTVASNGDNNPYGVAFVPQNFQGGGKLAPGDILVSDFNSNSGNQATGSSIVRITPDGQQSTFFQGPTGIGLTTALGVLPQGFVLVGSTPATTLADGTNTVSNGGLIVLDSNGNEVMELTDSALLQGPWDLTINNVDATHAQVFVSNVLSGTVTRIDLTIPNGGTPQVESETQIASGFAHTTNSAALVVGPTGLAFDAKSGTLYVASTADNAIYAIKNADSTNTDQGKGKAVVQDPQHLHGPLALALAPNGDLIAANGDAVNADPNHPNELVEYTPQGKFVGQFQVDGGAPGAAFGLAVQQMGNQVRFAAVDDNNNTLSTWTYQTQGSSNGNGNDNGQGHGHGNNGGDSPSLAAPMSSSATSAPSSSLVQQIDALFQSFNAVVQSLETDVLAMDPMLSGFISMFNADVDALEAMIISKL